MPATTQKRKPTEAEKKSAYLDLVMAARKARPFLNAPEEYTEAERQSLKREFDEILDTLGYND